METLHRLFVLDGLLRSHRYPISKQTLVESLDCSNATFKRLLNVLRIQYGFPIEYCCQQRGYFYDRSKKIQIPGLWFSANELQALLTIQQLLKNLHPSLLNDYFNDLALKAKALIAAMGKTYENITERLRIIPIAHQQVLPEIFLPLSQATLNGHKLNIEYQDIHGKNSERIISPQRLVYYRDHWYLDAWCHLRESLRIFWVAGVKSAKILDQPARYIDQDLLDQQVKAGYGIFIGESREIAHLKFTGLAAMRVRDAQWHPDQRQLIGVDGSVELWIPYNDPRELIMDILRYGFEVEVLEPASLREEVTNRLKMALNLYENSSEAQSVSLKASTMQ